MPLVLHTFSNMYLIFDTETTGLPKRWDAPLTDLDNWPRCIQIAWQLHDASGTCIDHQNYLIKPKGFTIPFESEQVHGISTALSEAEGTPLETVLEKFVVALKRTKHLVGHNINFDRNIMGAEFIRINGNDPLESFSLIDTCTEETAALCQLPGGRGGKFKLPTLGELYYHLFESRFEEAHNATADVEATSRVFLELLRQVKIHPSSLEGEFPEEELKIAYPEGVPLLGLKHKNLKVLSKQYISKIQPKRDSGDPVSKESLSALAEASFVHLHNHSQFSVLQATSRVNQLVEAAAQYKMPALALTDHANLMGAFHFVKAIKNHNSKVPPEAQIKPIVGCEFYVCENHLDRSRRDDGYQVVFLARNKKGYQNLIKLTSLAYTDGFYYVPRIDKKILLQFKNDLIVLTGNMYGEVPSKILNVGDTQAEEALLWWQKQFGNDLYIELMRHGQEDEDRVNSVLIQWSQKHNIQLIATNNTYYVNKDEANAHDILLCLKEGEKQATPIGRGRGYRYGFPNQEYYFKSPEAMKAIFKDVPEAILNLQELIDKIVPYDLAREVLLPKFDIPKAFQVENKLETKTGENNYLRHLAYEGAKKRYDPLTLRFRNAWILNWV